MKTRLLGMALVRGLVGVEALGKAVARGREHGRDPLGELQAWGILGPEDLEVLMALPEVQGESAFPETDQDPTPMRPRSVTSRPLSVPAATAGEALEPGAGEARNVLDALRLRQWKQYRDLRFQGQGGMGRIFRGFDPVLKRPVALKFLTRDDPSLIIRFIMEAQHQAKVDHPNICKVYEVGDWQGQSYIAMQFIRGKTLAAAREELTLDEIVRIMETVAEAIHAAHSCGLVHRDLKPSNIMVERDEKGLTPYVLDFGLARGPEASGMTLNGAVLGTMGFMAPEQALGGEVRFPADIYALGATLYALLGGDPPFAESTGLELLRKTVEEEPPPLRKLRDGVPKDLETIARKCLEKEPERRYPSALALAADLRRFREGEPILAHPPSLAYTLGKRARKHKVLVGVSSLALAAVLLFAGMGIQARRTAATRALWAQRYGQEAERLEALLRYAHLLPAHDLQAELGQVRERLARLERTAANSSSAVSGPAAYALGRGFLAMGDVAAAQVHLKKAMDLGFQAPEVAHVYGRVLGLRFQAELDRIGRIPDPAIRQASRLMAEHQLRDVALAYLERGKDGALEAVEYDQALVAFYGRHHEQALGAARRAFAQTPWFYEAKELEGDILLDQARGLTSREEGHLLLAAAIACFQAARTIAPSDPGLYEREARACRLVADLDGATGEDPKAPCDQGLAILEREAVVAPGRTDLPALAASLHFRYSQFLQGHGHAFQERQRLALDATTEALRPDPTNLEALQTRMKIFRAMGLFAWYSAQDPLPDLDQAVDAGRRALAVAANDPAILKDLSEVFLLRMNYQAGIGTEYRTSWEAAKNLMEQGAKAFPDVAAFHLGLGEAFEEWADQELIHDRNPAQAVEEALKALDRAVQLDANAYLAHYNVGVAHMTRAQYELAAGTDPRPDLDQAMRALGRARSLKPDHFASFSDLMECHLTLARAARAHGESPMRELEAARKLYQEANRMNPGWPYWGFLMAQGDLVETQWLVQTKGPKERAKALFPQIETRFRLWLKSSASQFAWNRLAELYVTWAQNGYPQAISLGIEAALKSVALDKSYGPGYYRLGELESLAYHSGGPGSEAARAKARTAFLKAGELDPLKQQEIPKRLKEL